MDFPAVESKPVRPWVKILVGAVVVLSMAVVPYVLLVPSRLSYEVSGGKLRVEAALGVVDYSREVPLTEVRGATLTTLTGGRRVMGTGRPPDFCAGRYRFKETGSAFAAFPCSVTDVVVVEVPDDRWVLAPADREGFVRALVAGGSGVFPPALPGPASRWYLWLLLLFVPLFVALAALNWKLRRPLVYRVEAGMLHVPAHFSPVGVRLAGARVQEGPLGRAARVAGTSLGARFQLGLFRAGGRWVHVAATAKDGILVEGDRAVFVTPADRPAFLAALRDAGAVTG